MNSRADIFRAVFWMSGAIASFLAMALAGRVLSAQLDTFEIMGYRSMIGVAIMLVVVTLRGKWHEITLDRFGLHLVRNIAHFTGQNLWFFAITLVPLAQVFALEFTSPLWVLVLSPLVLGERLTSIRVISALMGFAGILMVTRPGAETLSPGVIAAAAAAVFFAVTTVSTKRLTRDITPLGIVFWMTVTQTVFGAVCAGWDMDVAVPSLQSLPLMLLIGCAGLFAHFCVTTALSFAPATVVVPIDFTRLPLAAIIGALFLNEPINIWILLGAIVIFAGNYLNIWAETRHRPQVDSPSDKGEERLT